MAAIERVIADAMDAVMEKVLSQDPFDIDERRRVAPMHTALVPEDIFRGSHFERRFVTPFGTVWEKLAAVIGENSFGFGTTQHMIVGRVRRGCLDRIQETLDNLEHEKQDGTRVRPDWKAELRYVRGGTGAWQDVSVNCDVYVATGSSAPGMAFELKAALPNSDQTKVSKEKLLKLLCMVPRTVSECYFALPYNPYGRREDYGWSFPQRWFDMRRDPCVLIGDELWNKLGGGGTYQQIISIAQAVGRRYRRRIYEDYLRLPVPNSNDD